jgi:hypothetical protein
VGAISVAVVSFFLSANYSALQEAEASSKSPLQRWLGLDWLGTVLCLGFVTTLLLPLQWGGNTRPWSSPVVIALFPVFGVLILAFLAWEYHLKNRALLPFKLFKNRTQVGCSLLSFWMMLQLLVGIYYLPLFYQAKGHSATRSGIDILPFMMLVVAGAMCSGIAITVIGRYYHFLIVGPLISTVGAGLLYTITSDMA